jgi:hypothetical protein
MEIRTIRHAGVPLVHLEGAMEVGHLYGLAGLSGKFRSVSGGAGRIFDLRQVTNHVGALSDLVQAAEDWANRMVSALLEVDNWHLARDLTEAFEILQVDGREEDVLPKLTRQPPLRLAPEVPTA